MVVALAVPLLLCVLLLLLLFFALSLLSLLSSCHFAFILLLLLPLLFLVLPHPCCAVAAWAAVVAERLHASRLISLGAAQSVAVFPRRGFPSM